jgi:hypothetical protein
MNHRCNAVTAVTVLVLLLGGCRGGAPPDPLPVGTCVRVDDGGTTAVACAEPHTHKVIAIAPRAEECPRETNMYSQPADPDHGTTTTCFQSHTTAE